MEILRRGIADMTIRSMRITPAPFGTSLTAVSRTATPDWQLRAFPEMPYRTTIFPASLDVGEIGIRVIGAVWLAAGVGFILLAAPTLTRTAKRK